MKKIITLFLVAIVGLSGCVDKSNKRVPGQPYIEFEGTNGNGVNRIYNAEGSLETEVPYKDSLPNGIQKEYYKTGQLFRETPFVQGKANGVVKEYSTSGKLYREMPVVDGKANGVVKKYYTNGCLFSEAPFVSGIPVAGLNEYNENGILLEKPKMVFSAKNRILVDGTYRLEISLSNEYIQAQYYQILLVDNKETPNELPIVNGKGVLKLYVPADSVLNKKLLFEAKYTTIRNNVCIIRDSYNLSVK